MPSKLAFVMDYDNTMKTYKARLVYTNNIPSRKNRIHIDNADVELYGSIAGDLKYRWVYEKYNSDLFDEIRAFHQYLIRKYRFQQ